MFYDIKKLFTLVGRISTIDHMTY